MDFAETEEQGMLRRAARGFLEDRFPVEAARRLEATGEAGPLWQEAAALGWLGCGLAEAEGGAGGDLRDVLVLAEEIGRAAFPLPVLPTILAGMAGATALLPGLADGGHRVTLASEPVAAAPRADGALRLDGRLRFLREAERSAWLLCATDDDTLALVPLADPHVTLRPLRVIGRDSVADAEIEGAVVPASRMLRGPGLARRTLDRAAILGCGVILGTCERMLELAIRHAMDRRQFGQPIGSYQALQHLCADMAIDLANMRHLATAAAWADATEDNAAEATAMARLWTVQAVERIRLGTHKLHGAIGLTEEHALSLLSRRLLGLRQEFGEADRWADRLAGLLGIGDAHR